MLLSRVSATIRRYRMFQPGQAVGVAVSGGADSVCLLHILLDLLPQWNLRLRVLHLNHGLRGPESQCDEQFVRDLAGQLGLEAAIGSADLSLSGGNLEQAGRKARLQFYRHQRAAGLDRIAVGHTRNDQAETVLFRFLRGSGAAGLAGIRPVTGDGIVRPLLDVSRSEVEQYLRDRNIGWREDSSNAGLRFARNRIRHQLLPNLQREWNPALVETLHRAADWALAEEEYWESEIARLSAGRLIERGGALLVPVQLLRELPVAASRRLVRYCIQLVKGDLRGVEFNHIVAIMNMVSAGGRGEVHLPGLQVVRSFEWVRLVNPADRLEGYRLPVAVPGTVGPPGAEFVISLDLIEKSETRASRNCVYNSEKDCLDWRGLSGQWELRNWKPGDRYQPQGSSAEEKIKTLFQKARIPIWERAQWPVLTCGSAIVWARQFGPASRFAASPESPVLLKIREVGRT